MERLFVYGSLQPGGPNEHVLASVKGEWVPATLKGRLIASGWGASLGYPGLVLDDDADDIGGYVFYSPDLAALWGRLDEFEGTEYERIVASATLENGHKVEAHVYALRGR